MAEPIILTFDKTLYKKCIKCRAWKPRQVIEVEDGEDILKGFGDHDTSSDGLQSICFKCKNVANVAARKKNVPARIRHHTATRCLTQLGEHAPDGLSANLEDYLGYKITALVKHLRADLKEREGPKRKLRDALNEGYHIDHIIPLSSFMVLVDESGDPALVGKERAKEMEGKKGIDWNEFRKCWAMNNLRAIPAEENLAKGAN